MTVERTFFLFGLGVGVVIVLMFDSVWVSSAHSKAGKYNKVIELCEQNIPRNQKCVITAIPQEKINAQAEL